MNDPLNTTGPQVPSANNSNHPQNTLPNDPSKNQDSYGQQQGYYQQQGEEQRSQGQQYPSNNAGYPFNAATPHQYNQYNGPGQAPQSNYSPQPMQPYGPPTKGNFFTRKHTLTVAVWQGIAAVFVLLFAGAGLMVAFSFAIADKLDNATTTSAPTSESDMQPSLENTYEETTEGMTDVKPTSMQEIYENTFNYVQKHAPTNVNVSETTQDETIYFQVKGSSTEMLMLGTDGKLIYSRTGTSGTVIFPYLSSQIDLSQSATRMIMTITTGDDSIRTAECGLGTCKWFIVEDFKGKPLVTAVFTME